MRYKLFFVIVTCVSFFIGNYLYQSFEASKDFNNHLKMTDKTCPAAYFVNRMPMGYTGFSVSQFVQQVFRDYVIDVHRKVTNRLWINYLNEKGLSIFLEGGYFVDNSIDHKRKELFDTDLEWVSQNCNIKPGYVY